MITSFFEEYILFDGFRCWRLADAVALELALSLKMMRQNHKKNRGWEEEQGFQG